jgi:uncharacterized membrane protein YdjX (TVP38/TMEM64 family)
MPNQKDGEVASSPVSPSATPPRRRFSPWLPVVGLALLALFGLAVWQWGKPLLDFFRDQEQVREWLSQFGPLAPLISILVNAVQVLLAPVPGQVIGLANGYLFGVFWGTVYSLLGVTLGTALAMVLGRLLGRPVVERFVSAAHLDRWDDLVSRRGPAFLFLVFLLPLLPDDIVAFAVGLSRISIPYVLILATVGRLPGLIASSWVGANATSLSPWGWAILGSGTLALAMVVLRYRERLERWLLALAQRLSPRRMAGPSPTDKNSLE